MVRSLASAVLGLVAVAAVVAIGRGQPEAGAAPARIVAPAQELSTLLGFVEGRLVRIDPETLVPLPGREVAVGSGGCASSQGGTACWANPPWTVSPDGALLAVARNDASSLRIVDVGRMRVATDLRRGFDAGLIGALAWLASGRVLAVEEAVGERQRVIVFDLARKRVMARKALGGRVLQLGRTGRELVLLLAPAQTIGPAKIALADPRGQVRFARLERIAAGSKLLGTGSAHRVDARLPGLAVDAQGQRAFVVAKELVAEVDLRTMAVSYHSLARGPSLLSRLWNWLEPAAQAKQVSGYHREARWLGGDLLGVSGSDTEQGRYRPAGLSTIGTRDWSARMVDRGAMLFQVSVDALIATGGWWDAAANRSTGIGVAAYGLDGTKRFQVLDGEHAWVAEVYGGRAYVGIAGQGVPLRIVELSTGRVVGTRAQPLPTLLRGSDSWSDG